MEQVRKFTVGLPLRITVEKIKKKILKNRALFDQTERILTVGGCTSQYDTRNAEAAEREHSDANTRVAMPTSVSNIYIAMQRLRACCDTC